MATSVVMPALEMAQETGKLVSWLKREGEPVARGEPLLEVETDKATVEIESPGEGILAGVTARIGDVVPVGRTIAWLVQPGEAPPVEAAPAQTGRRTESASTQGTVSGTIASDVAATTGVRISPKARRLAKEHGVDISRVRGSGSGGEILAEDVLTAAQSQAPASSASAPTAAEVPSSIGRLMAERTTESWTTVPHFFVAREVDATAMLALRQRMAPAIERERGVKPTHTDVLVALVACILRKHPRMNASWAANGIRLNHDVNIGVAMAVDDGVVVPVIRHADIAGVADIAVRRRELTERARAGKLQPADLTGATFTISNLGMYQVDAFTAIIVSPQAGILAVGAIADRVVPVDGHVVIRPIMTVTLSSDHRVVDGARAAAFLKDVVEAIRAPEAWLG